MVLPEGLTTIGSEAFADCAVLFGLYVPETVTSISASSFAHDEFLTVYGVAGGAAETYCTANAIPFAVGSIPEGDVGSGVTEAGLAYAYANGKAVITGYTGSDAALVIPAKVDGYEVTALAYQAFKGNNTVTSVEIEAEITSVPAYCFYQCSKLESVQLPDSVESIGEWSFYYCGKLSEINWPEDLTEIKDVAFGYCHKLTDVSFDGVTIGGQAFAGCTGLTEVTVQNVEEICYSAFRDCTSLETVNLVNVKKVSSGAFSNNTALVNWSAEGLEVIGEKAFFGCISLSKVILPEGLTTIGSEAFADCTVLSGVYIPATVTSIADSAFDRDYFLVISTDCTEDENEETHPVLKFAKKRGHRHMKFKFHDKGWHGHMGKDHLDGHDGKHGMYWMTGDGWVWFDPDAVGHIQDNSPGDLELDCGEVREKPQTGHDKMDDQVEETLNNGGKVYDFTLKSEEQDVPFSDGEDGSVEIHVPYEPGKEDVRVYHIDEDGKKERVPSSYDKESGRVSFETHHFSYYSVETGPVIVTDPADTEASIGEVAAFTVVAEGTDLTYQWQYSVNGTSWINTTLAGYSTDTLRVTASAVTDGRQYRCVVTDQDGYTATSLPGVLTVKVSVKITGHPENQAGYDGEFVYFTVEAEGENLTYQWQYKPAYGTVWNNTTLTGYDTDTLRVPVSSDMNKREFRCVVTAPDGGEEISLAATLTRLQKFEIVRQPEDKTINYLGSTTISVNATGESLSYQWQYSVDGGQTWNNTSFTNGGSMHYIYLRGNPALHGRMFRCVITDIYGDEVISESATLYVNTPLQITEQPADQYVFSGEDAQFSVYAIGMDVGYQWQFSTDGGDSWENSDLTGNGTNTLTVPANSGYNGYQFRCWVFDQNSQLYSEVATLTVEETAVLEITTHPEDILASERSWATFTVEATGRNLIYQWQYSANGGTSWSDTTLTGYDTAALQVKASGTTDRRQYRCIVQDAEGNTLTSEPATLYVLSLNTLSSGIMDDLIWVVESTGMMTISSKGGSGEMVYPPNSSGVPWSGFAAEITWTVLEEGVTTIGQQAFEGFFFMTSISLPSSLTAIKPLAFVESGLTEITIPAGVTSIGGAAFSDCFDLQTVTFEGEAPAIESDAFEGVTATVHYPGDDSSWDGVAGEDYGGNLTWKAVTSVPVITTHPEDVEVEHGATATFHATIDAVDDGEWSWQWQYKEPGSDEWQYLAVAGGPATATLSVVATIEKNGYQYRCEYHGEMAEDEYIIYSDPATLTVTIDTSCGENLVWTWEDDGTLFITGKGAMLDYDEEPAPWSIYSVDMDTVIIGDGVTSVGKGAFADCSGVKKVTFEGDAPAIADDAFTGVTAYARYNVDGGWDGTNMLDYGGKLIWIPDNARSYGKCGDDLYWMLSRDYVLSVFGTGDMYDYLTEDEDEEEVAPWYGYRINSVVVESGVTSIGDYAFWDNSRLKKVTLPESLESIGEGAFAECSGLTEIHIPAGVKYIGTCVFEECDDLSSVTIAGTPEMEDDVFDSLSLTITVTPEQMEWAAAGSSGWGGNIRWLLGRGPCGDLDWTLDVTGLLTLQGEGALTADADGSYPFDSLKKYISSISVKAGVTDIGTAFADCQNLKNVNLSKATDLTAIAEGAFAGITDLTRVSLPSGLTTVGKGAFSGCTALEQLTVPASVTEIGENAFADCTALKNLTFAGNAPTVGDDAFRNVDVVIDAPEYSEAWQAIMDAQSDTVTWRFWVHVGKCGETLYWERSYETLTIYGEGAMNDYRSKGTPWFIYRDALEDIIVQEGVTVLGEHAFEGCFNATSVTLPKSLTAIKGGAFVGCSMKKLELPAALTYVGSQAFAKCYKLSEVYFMGTQKQWDQNVEQGVSPFPTGLKFTCNVCYMHSFTNYQVITPATCQKEGVEQAECDTCYLTKQRKTELGGHDQSGEWVVDIPATDSTMGSHVKYCTVCDEICNRKPFGPDNAVGCGVIGERLTWVLEKNGTLTITGVGIMEDYAKDGAPWREYGDRITAVVIPAGVENLFSGAFWNCTNLINVYYAGTEEQWTTLLEALNSVVPDSANVYCEMSPDRILDIITQPEDQSADSGFVYFNVEATGINVEYQWQYSLNGVKWRNTTLKGYSTEELRVPVNSTTNGRWYRCVISNEGGELITDPAKLTLLTSLEILEQPEDKSAPGGYVYFTVETEGTDLTYQWQYRTAKTDWTNTTLTGYNTDTLRVTASATTDGRQYRCIIVDAYGSKVVSDAATLTLAPEVAILTQPEDQSASEDYVYFTVEAEGAELTYQWQYSANKGSTWNKTTLKGYDTEELRVPVNRTTNGRWYRCVVTDVTGSEAISDGAVLTMTSNLKITEQPEDVTALSGTAFFAVEISGGIDVNYQWQYRTAKTGWTDTTLTGFDTDTLKVAITATTNGRQYRCVVTDAYGGEEISDAATLTMGSGLKITEQPGDQSVAIGETVAFTVEAEGEIASWKWEYSTNGTKWNDTALGGWDTDTLEFKATSAMNGRWYRCVVTDVYGEVVTSEPAQLTVKAPELAIISQPEDQTASSGYVYFTVEAEGEGLTYQWQYKTATGTGFANTTLYGAKTDTLRVGVSSTTNGRQYRCIITDASGEEIISDAATLTVE